MIPTPGRYFNQNITDNPIVSWPPRSPNPSQVSYTLRRDPYNYRAIRLESTDMNLNSPTIPHAAFVALLFNTAKDYFLGLSSSKNYFFNQHQEERTLSVLQSISGYRDNPKQIFIVYLAMNTLNSAQNPEIYSTLLYILKHSNFKDKFGLAHDIFLKARKQNALSHYSIQHYLTIGFEEGHCKIITPIAIDLCESHPDIVPKHVVHNLVFAGHKEMTDSQLARLRTAMHYLTAS